MVEYFGEQLEGFTFTANGWVQSYGSRCVKPPIIYGDVQRPQAMTVQWAQYAQSLTAKPMKGMDTHVSRVRNKLQLKPENGFRLVPVYSYGYRLEKLGS